MVPAKQGDGKAKIDDDIMTNSKRNDELYQMRLVAYLYNRPSLVV